MGTFRHSKNTIIWTRSKEDFASDQALFGSSTVLHLPCISTRALAREELSPFLEFLRSKMSSPSLEKAAVYTSWRAAEQSLLRDEIREFLKDAKIFCFGAKTKSYFTDRAFEVSYLGNLRSAREIPQALRGILTAQTFILLPGPRIRAFALEEALRREGYESFGIDLYETIPELRFSDGHLPSEDEKRELIASLQGVVFFASPSACQGFVEALKPHTNRLRDALHVLAMGPSTAESCRKYFRHVSVSRENDLKTAFADIVRLQM